MSTSQDRVVPEDFAGEAGELAFTQIRDGVDLQMETGAHLDRKATTLFSIATAGIGIALPLVLSHLAGNPHAPYRELLIYAAALPGAVYVAGVVFFLIAITPAKYLQVRNPSSVKGVLQSNHQEALAQLWQALDKSFQNNTLANERKSRWVRRLAKSVAAQTILTVLYALAVAILAI